MTDLTTMTSVFHQK